MNLRHYYSFKLCFKKFYKWVVSVLATFYLFQKKILAHPSLLFLSACKILIVRAFYTGLVLFFLRLALKR